MGGQQSTAMKSTLSFVSDTTFSSIVSVQSTCKTTSNSSQALYIGVSTDPSVLKDCMALGWSPKDCDVYVKRSSISGINQSADIAISSNCKFDNDSATQLQNSISAQLQSKMQDQTDAVGQALMNMTQALGGNSQTSLEMNQTISNTVKESFSSSTVNDMISAYTTAQDLKIDVNTAAADIASITQFTKLKAVADMMGKNSTVASAANTVDAAMAADEAKKVRGVTDVVDTAGGVINNAVDKGTGVLNNAIFGISMVWIGIGGAAVVGLIILMIFLFKGSKASTSYGPQGQMTAAYGPSPANQFMQMAPQLMQMARRV